MKQLVFLGDTSTDRLHSCLHNIGSKKIFLVRGKKSYELCGAKHYIESAIAPLNCTLYEFYEFEENPKISDVERGLTYLVEQGADIVVAIGGGSVIDMAKLIRFFYSYKGDFKKNNFIKEKELLPFISIPTTAGTGSEATHFAVVYKDRVKHSVAHKDILSDISIINPSFTYNNPKYLAACTGFDALAQAIEAYWSIHATEESDSYAIHAIELLWKNMPLAVNSKIKESLNNISEGSYWAGKAINIAKTTAPHAMSYAFTSYYNVPHGHAVALTFPFFIAFNTNIPEKEYKGNITHKNYVEKINILFTILEVDKSDLISFVFQNYISLLGLSSVLGFDKKIIISNINMERMENNPRALTQKYINDVLDSIHL
ncbi:alcohol dehydrogenase [Spirochaetia bacterium]|nr:alcohol dehydrogenase [Spirochaetia bacterium]